MAAKNLDIPGEHLLSVEANSFWCRTPVMGMPHGDNAIKLQAFCGLASATLATENQQHSGASSLCP